jgi:protein O-mannosyl-transferase
MKEWMVKHGKAGLITGLLFLLTMALFWPATGYDFLNFDDDRYVSGNQIVRQGLSIEGLKWAFRYIYESYWLPVMWLSYMADSTIFGTKAFGYHFTNILLHALNAALLFVILRSWTGRTGPALFAAALFAWHPLRVESVAWIAERKDVLSGFFFLLSLAFYKRYSRNPVTGREVPAALFMALGLMTKPMLVTLPFLLLLLDYWPLNRVQLTRESLKSKARGLITEKLLFWCLTGLFCYLTFYTQMIGSSIHSTEAFPLMQRLAFIPPAYLFYLQKFLFPVHLSMIYGELNASAIYSLIAGILMLAITAAALWAGLRSKAVPVGWFWFLGLMVPVIGFVRVGVIHVADRFTYLPAIGLGVCIAWGAAELLPKRAWVRTFLWCAAVLLLSGAAWQTRQVLPIWTNSVTAFENVLRYLPEHGLANNNYGEALLGFGQTEKALEHFDRAIAIDTNTTPFIANSAIALLLLNRTDEAIVRLERALREKNPYCPFLNFALGLSWMEANQPEKAIPFLKSANMSSMIRPTWRVELARAYIEAGRMAEASNEFAVVTQHGWDHLTTFEGMCHYYAALWERGHGRRAWTFFERTVAIHSNNIALLNNVAWLLATDPPAGAPLDEAVLLATRAKDLCEIVPPNILDTLAAAYAAQGKFEEAMHWAKQARAAALSNNMTALANQIEARINAYQSGTAWGKSGPARP